MSEDFRYEYGTEGYCRHSRGDGTGVIVMPAEEHATARQDMLDRWTAWSMRYLKKCGHHTDELAHVESSLRDVLAQWWDARNSFDRPGNQGHFFPETAHWASTWTPSLIPHDYDPHDERAQELANGGFIAGIQYAHRLMTRRREAYRKPSLCERVVSVFKPKQADDLDFD